jgi:hypothetical protein
MKITQYDIRRDGDQITVIAGPLVDLDLQGGLEDLLWREVASGATQVRIVLGGMRFLHAGLTSCLLAIQRHLEPLGGDVVLVDTPKFVRLMMKQWGVESRFLFSDSSISGPLYYTDNSHARITVSKLKQELIEGGIDPYSILG